MKNPHWKGGRRLREDGYIEVRVNTKRHYQLEHRLVAAIKVGRKLKSTEDVHHLNGIKTDNRSENLLVLSKVEHSKLHGNTTH